jgi:hypothetical protein
MMAISIRQPWAWLIVRPDLTDPVGRACAYDLDLIKPVENRTWPTAVRGEVLIHAAKGMTREEYLSVESFLEEVGGPTLPPMDQLDRGGIIGKANQTDCVTKHPSRYFFGPYGFVLHDSQPIPFIPYRGQLGFFFVPDNVVATAIAQAGSHP